MLLAAVILSTVAMLSTANAAPGKAPINGEVKLISIDNAADPWSGGRIVVGGQNVVIPRNFIFDLPANRLSLRQLYADAPEACLATGETGLAKGDRCNQSGTGAMAVFHANITEAGDVIAGQARLDKGVESVFGNVTFIDYTDGYLRVNGIAGDPGTGVMVRINDPTGRFTIQRGLGCLSGAPNCSADIRYGVDSENYTVNFATGYPACIPSTITGGNRIAGSDADGGGDPLCPETNRTVNNGTPVDNSFRFAPIRIGDSIAAFGNFESVGGVEFLSAHTLRDNAKLTTLPGQPDYMVFDEVDWDVAGFQNRQILMLLEGATTLPDSQLDVFAIHFDRETGQTHEYPIASTVNNPSTINKGLLPTQFNLFSITYHVDFLVGTDPELSPCVNLANAGFAPAPAGFGCPGGGNLFIDQNFAVINPPSRDIIGRTRNKAAFAIGDSVDISGNAAFNGRYLNPVDLVHTDMAGVDVAAAATPFIFTGIPWNLDRRLGPGGCGEAPCEPTDPANPFKYALSPFPFSGLDPRTQAATPPGVLPSFPGVPVNVANKILSYYPFGAGNVFPWDNVTLVPPAQGIAPTPEVRLAITQLPAPPASSVVLSSNPASPQPGDTAITFIASATGGTGIYEYEFQTSIGGGPFFVARNYTSDPTWFWNSVVGAYDFRVNVRNAGSTAAAEATSAALDFVVTGTPAATGATLAANPASPQPVGTAVTFVASGSGGSGVYEYQFQASLDGVNFFVARNYTSDPTWFWATAPGTFHFRVNVRSLGSTAAAEATSAVITYTIGTVGPVAATGATLAGNPPETTPPAAGTPVTFTAAGAGGSGSYEFQFQASLDGVNFFVARHYTTDNTWIWGTASGTYSFRVNVRNVSSTAAAEATSAVLTYVID
jgi:hypothetical protein